MKCAIMQPTYIPWLGYFDLIDSTDKFVFLDDVKLERCSWQVRNRMKSHQGELILTIPVRRTKGRDKLIINEAIINNNKMWRKNHLKSIFYAYKKSEFFDEIYPFLEKLIFNDVTMLRDFNINIIRFISHRIGINTEFILSSNLKSSSGEKDMRLVSICKELNCNEYISPLGSAVYIERGLPGGSFPKNNIDLYYQNYQHPVYNQRYVKFLSHMSIIDLLFNHGFEASLGIIRSGRRKPIDYLSFRKSNLNNAK